MGELALSTWLRSIGLAAGLFLASIVMPGCGSDTLTSGGSGECVPDCLGLFCGDDGCGGLCGACPDWAPVCDQGTCQMEAPPGADVGVTSDTSLPQDGGSTQPQDQTSSPSDTSVPPDTADGGAPPLDTGCVAQCAGKMCGDDGCGGSCGLCPPQAAYCEAGQCTVCDQSTCGGQLEGNPDFLCNLHDPAYGSGKLKCEPSCEIDTSLCVPAADPGAHGSVCNPSQQNFCADSLWCLPLPPAGSASYCLQPCSNDAACPEGWSCEVISGDNQVCMPAVMPRDAPCWENFQACSDPSHQCMNTTQGDGGYADWRCKLTCSGLGSTAGCPGGETCLKNTNGHMVPAKEGGTWKVCSPGLDPCGGLQSCLPVGGGNHFCYDPVGWCGEAVPMCGGLSAEDHAQCAVSDPCEASDASLYCTLGSGDPSTLANPGFAVCVDVPDNLYGACVGFCELASGELANCGPGYSCVQPGPDDAMLYYASQPGGPPTCTGSSDCDMAGQFFCATLSTDPQPRCYRGYRMCQAQ